MSWEVMSNEVKKCQCGKGTRHYVSEMDDWNNYRSTETYTCEVCYEAALEYKKMRNKAPNPAKHDHTTYRLVK